MIYCDQQKDSVDLALMKEAKSNDIVVTSDLGLAALALSRDCHVIDFDGRKITSTKIDTLLFERYVHQKMRKQKKYLKSKRPRQAQDDENFFLTLKLCLEENHVPKRT